VDAELDGLADGDAPALVLVLADGFADGTTSGV
jgi:hypothetical protein